MSQQNFLNESDIDTLINLLLRSQQSRTREALCFSIGIDPKRLSFLRDSSDEDFFILLIRHLNEIGDQEALCKLCCKELFPIFHQGTYGLFLSDLAGKLNCSQEFRQNYPNNKQPTSSSSSPTPSVSVNPFNQLAKNKLVIGAVGVIIAAFITAGLPFLKIEKPTPTTPATPTNNSSPTDSSPTLKITQPSQEGKVSRLSNFNGTFENLPAGSGIILYIRSPVENKYYCYTAMRDIGNDGHWHVNQVNIGGQGNSDRGANYDVSVLVLDSKTNKESQFCQGGSQVLTQPSNTIARDDISVIRQ